MISNFDSFLNEKNFQVVIPHNQLEGLPNFHIQQNLEDALNKEFKREGVIEFRTDAGYPGAGYAFDLVLDKIVKRLNK